METAERLADIAARLLAREELMEYVELDLSELMASGLWEHYVAAMRWAFAGQPDDDLRYVMAALTTSEQHGRAALKVALVEIEQLEARLTSATQRGELVVAALAAERAAFAAWRAARGPDSRVSPHVQR
jgi:hypothetical protein